MSPSASKVYAADALGSVGSGGPAALERPDGAALLLKSSVARPTPAADWVRRPRRAFQRQVVRPLQRRYKTLPWTTRQMLSICVTLYAMCYILVSVPLRIGFFYDPIERDKADAHWTPELTVFTVLDVICDTIGVHEFLEFYRTWQDAFSMLSESVSFEVGKKLSKKAHHRDRKPNISTRNRQNNNVPRGSQAQWTLAALVPAIVSAHTGQAIRRRKNFEMALELVALAPIEIIVLCTRQYNLLHVLRLTKLCRMYRIRDCLDKIRRIYGERRWIQRMSLTGISKLIRNISIGVILSHWVACGYMWIAHRACGVALDRCDPSIESSWVIRDRLIGASTLRKYGRAIYWSSRTMVLLGYDDVTPVSDNETIYGLVVQVVGAVLSTSLLATFLFIFRHRNSRQAAFNTHVDNAREYMKSQNLPREVRRQVTSYFSYAWNTHHSLDGEEVLHLLPKHLESKVVYTLKASRIKQVCFLMKESAEFINLLALALVHRVYIPNDSIIEPKINAKMFFVIRGTVVLSAFDGSHPKECQTGDFFADCCLLAPETYEEKAVAKTFCELYVLEKEAFDDAISHFYRGRELETLDRMALTLEKYSTQLRKTKKLLGLRGAEENGQKAGSSSSSVNGRGGLTGGPNSWRLLASTFRIRWDVIRLMATIFVAFEVPYYIVFISNHDAQKNFVVSQDIGARYLFTLIVEVFFACDFALRCRFLAYLDPVVMINVVDPSMIFTAYKSNGFYADLVSVVPVSLVMESLQGGAEDYSWIVRVLRLLRLRYVGDIVQDITDYYGVSSKIQLVLSLLLGVTLMLHMVACLWFEMSWIPLSWDEPLQDNSALANISRQECLRMATLYLNCSWVRYDCYGQVGATFPFEDSSSEYRTTFAYVRSMYWAVAALTGVGYGDIAAFSTAESYFAALWIFIGGIINFGVVGAMSSTIGNMLAPRHHHVERLNILNEMMEHLGITESLRSEIRRFYHHQFKTRKKAYESQLLTHLPDQLCYRISTLLHSEATRRVTLFDSASRELLEEVTGKFRHRTYQNGETLYIEGDICKEFIVLTHGKVNMFHQSRTTCPVGALHDGDCYGVNEFLLKRPHAVTLVAASTINASVMAREHFEVILRKFDDEMQDIHEEAYNAWVNDTSRLKRISRNFDCLKLKPHVLNTPSLFYQKDLHQLGDRAQSVTVNGSQRHVGSFGGAYGVKSDIEIIRSRISGIWNVVLTFWNMYTAFSVIFRIAFHSHIHDATSRFMIVDLICDAFYLADIYLTMYFFDIEDAGFDNLLSRAEINSGYRASRQFKRDIVASLPIYYMSSASPFGSSVCRLPRILRCFDLWGYIDETIILIQQTFASKNVSSYLSPAKLFFFLLLGAHFAACIFFWISENECEHHPTHCWMTHDHILHENHHSLVSLYLRSFYWGLTTLALVGSREVVPRDVVGTLWAVLTCLGCTFIMGYIIGEISEVILDMDKKAKEYKARIDSFEHFAKEHGFSETLRNRVALFFKVQQDHSQSKELDEAVHDLSANLKLKLMHEIYGSAIATLPISRFLTHSQVNNLALRLRTELFIPGDDIVVEDTAGTRLCIMRSGLAAVLWSESVTSVAVLMQGCLFGEVGFFLPRQRRIATVKATTSCEVLHISKIAWNELWGHEETHVQKYSLSSILDWVRGRMLRYQENALNVAKRTNRHIMERKIMENLRGMTAPAPTKSTKPHLLFRTQSFLTPEALVLEKKAKYLLSKADKYTKHQRHLITDLAVATGLSMASANMDNLGHRRATTQHTLVTMTEPGGNNTGKKTLKTVNQNFRQFFADVNPVNKHIVSHLDDHHLNLLETESWRRYRYMATLQHTISVMMEALMPRDRPHHQLQDPQRRKAAQSPSPSALPRRGRRSSLVRMNAHRPSDALEKTAQLRRMHTYHTDDSPIVMHHQRSAAVAASLLTDTSHESRTVQPHDHRLFTTVNATPPSDEPLRRMLSQQSARFLLTRAVSITSSTSTSQPPDLQRAAMLHRMKRCHSLPHFDRKYFETVKMQEESKRRTLRGTVSGIESTLLGSTGINFDILQRSRRPKLSTLYHWYRRFKRWQTDLSGHSSNDSTRSKQGIDDRDGTVAPPPSLPLPFQKKSSGVSASRRASSMRWRRFQHHVQGSKSVHADSISIEFQAIIKRIIKTWDYVMLLVALFYSIAEPLKAGFVHALQWRHGLKSWSAFEYFLDFVSLVDILYRLRHAKSQIEQNSAAPQHSASHRPSAFSLVMSSIMPSPLYDGFFMDVVALLPLEVFALTVKYDDGVSWRDHPYSDKWLYLSFLRLNRVLFASRLQKLSESVIQYVVYDLKAPIEEALLYFMRSLCSYLLMGHWIACIWYGTSEKGFYEFATSWMSYAGMLVFATDPLASPKSDSSASSSHHMMRMLSSTTSSSSLDLSSVSLTRKYLRSMHFAIGSITTLWYGDISSLNMLELLVEMMVILASIYIYGSLVGAHGELIDVHSRRKAVFEQNLTELQHYLLQNNVPKALKKQVKQYYASIWRRRNGEEEFEAIANVSRGLYEDVVYATLHRFAWTVSIFHSLDVHFLRALLVKLQYVVCSEDEEVVIRGDVDRSMYFISQGRILVKHLKSEMTKEKGDYFGELALLYGIPRGETCIALTVSELYRLDSGPYEELLLEFPEYRARNRAEWTTTEPPPSVLTSLLQTSTMGSASLSKVASGQLLTVNINDGSATGLNVSMSAVLDEEVPRSYVYKSTMEMLSQLHEVDSLQAKHIIIQAKRGARRHIKRITGILTARGGREGAEGEDDGLTTDEGGGSRPTSPSSKRPKDTIVVHEMSPRTASVNQDDLPGSPRQEDSRIQKLKQQLSASATPAPAVETRMNTEGESS